jgi:hypothetical protein
VKPVSLPSFLSLPVITLLSLSSAVGAHPGHGPDERRVLSEADAKAHAQLQLEMVVAAGKADASWRDAPVTGFTAITRQGRTEWLATFENAKAKAPQPRELCLVVNLYGEAVAGGPALNEADARLRVKEEIARLVKVNKLPASWSALSPSKLEKRKGTGYWEWVATVDNVEGEAGKQRLFVFLWPYGEFAAANFTGK